MPKCFLSARTGHARLLTIVECTAPAAVQWLHLLRSLLITPVCLLQVMGDSFVHGGSNTSGPPAYIDPETLLSEPTIDPYIPYQ